MPEQDSESKEALEASGMLDSVLGVEDTEETGGGLKELLVVKHEAKKLFNISAFP